MKNIFAFIGSPLKERSNTWTLTMLLIERLREIDKEIKADVLTAGHVNIRYAGPQFLRRIAGQNPG